MGLGEGLRGVDRGWGEIDWLRVLIGLLVTDD